MRSGRWEGPYDEFCMGECGLTCSECIEWAHQRDDYDVVHDRWGNFSEMEDEMEEQLQAFFRIGNKADPWEELMSHIRQAVDEGSWKR